MEFNIQEYNQEIQRFKREISVLRSEIGYWKKLHERARKREEKIKTELADKNARIKYLEHQLYNRKTERSNRKNEKTDQTTPGERPRGHQQGTPAHQRRDYNELEEKVEVHDLPEGENICSICGRPFRELPVTEDSDIIEIKVKGYKRKIKRKKYVETCQCKGNNRIITAPGPCKLVPKSKIGISIWACILIRKYRFQIPMARILKNLSLNGLDLPAGTIGDGLKRIAPMFEPIYSALEEKSRQAKWWQADETRWNVFETTKTKTSYRWYLWVFISSESIVYIIDPTRSAQVIEEHLGTVIQGILLVDRYSAYKSFARKRDGILLAFCWSHARRDFLDAGKKYPTLKQWSLCWEEKINTLFHLNGLRVQYPVRSQEFHRQDECVRQAITRMEDDFEQELQHTKLHHEQERVMRSLKNHWEGLTVFVDHPYIPMDNNGSERALRNSALGRKNYYGSGTLWSARFTAIMLSIFETLQLWGINQIQWLSEYLHACALEGGKPPPDSAPFLPWHIKEADEPKKVYCGRAFSKSDIACIKRIVNEDTSRNRTTISRIVCEYLHWYKSDGRLKARSMRLVLLKMEKDGYISLPPAEITRQVVQLPITHTKQTAPQEDIFIPTEALSYLSIHIAETKEEKSLWNEYIDRYHYMGYKTIPGAYLKYFIYAGDDLLCLMGFGPAAWRIAPRDEFIGWSDKARQENLHLIINNTRFLILPWIFSKNLASKILSLTSKRIADDWEQRYNYRPVLLETFVEKNRFSGTCYKAANWRFIGVTKGRGKKDRFHKVTLPQKNIFLYPITKNFEKILC
jgi:transposase